MPGEVNGLVDHSPHAPSAAATITTASNVILIDNYDSFTWNVYQYLVLEGARVTVYRNDEINLEDLIATAPTQLVISPGPGHPSVDAGISQAAIKYFSGKIPILGVCMGEQCIFGAFGGKVEVTGEILHGKTSILQHDGKGLYAGLPQDLAVTRYHSLAGTHGTLPDSLEVSSWVEKQDKRNPIHVEKGIHNGVIMGVRHKEFAIEGCQFHPESILTEQGRIMLKNFLKLRAGTWKENHDLQVPHEVHQAGSNSVQHLNGSENARDTNSGKQMSILEQIFADRKREVALQKEIPSQQFTELEASYRLGLAPAQISFPDRLRKSKFKLSLMAEIKRASPSKGVIGLDVKVPAQARRYALAGASVISVLTEPRWFKGHIDDLRVVRQSLQGMHNRPAVLRKEFIFDEYQILEARLAGADTILLIVKMLEESHLRRLSTYARELDMEPLIEVNTPEEMAVASRLNAQVIGVNNRNLATFDVDLETTSRLMDAAPQDSIVCALSGIWGPEDVEPYQKNGVGAVLVGEALMRASNTSNFVSNLLGTPVQGSSKGRRSPHLVKICGTRSVEAAETAIHAGADLIGIILVEGRTRCVSHETAKEISRLVHNTKRQADQLDAYSREDLSAQEYFNFTSVHHLRNSQRALIVGVFRNQPLSYILEKQKALELDIVQLHGSEPLEWASLIPVPVIRSFRPQDAGLSSRGHHAAALLDTGAGGSGQTLDLDALRLMFDKDPDMYVLLAGGLNPHNLSSQYDRLGSFQQKIRGFDVSSGVETDGVQDLAKIKQFVESARALNTA